MAAVAGPLHPVSAMNDDQVLDTRTPSPRSRATATESKEGDYKPDLSAEVALLSTKLVNAINHNTNLDDTLQASRHELEHYRQRCTGLEAENKRHENLVSSGVFVKKAEVDKVIAKLRAELTMERSAREAADKARKQTEGEVETLTSALFEEANSMVAAARKDNEVLERKNTQLKSQLQDTEMLLASQQEQLQDLKATMEKLQETQLTRTPSMPSTPITTSQAVFEALQLSPNSNSLADLPPEHPLHFSQLISPVLRSDTTAYNDFQDLLLLARRLGAHSRNPSNNSGQQTNNLSTFANIAATTSSPSLPGSFAFSNNSSPISNGGSSTSSVPPLRESKFYKRVLTEDIEPTLRLDLAPGLSFLSRRTVLGALLAGTLAVEPYPQNKHYFACTLCGENRRTEQHSRKYRFRTSEDDSVSKPLCDYCVSRLRATCDFVGFLRMVRDGYWKCDSEDDQKSAWEESVRLRERMFWSRVGGGVVPCLQFSPNKADDTPSSAAGAKNTRPSLESIPEDGAKASLETTSGDEQSTDSDVFQAKTTGGIGDAIVSMSRKAAAVSTPEMRPAETSSVDPVTPPQADRLDPNDDADDDAAQPETPFQDAAQELVPSVLVAAEMDDQSKADQGAGTSLSSPQNKDPVTVETKTIDSEASSEVSLQQPTNEPKETTRRSALPVEAPAQDRKISSVHDRIRALQAAAGRQ